MKYVRADTCAARERWIGFGKEPVQSVIPFSSIM